MESVLKLPLGRSCVWRLPGPFRLARLGATLPGLCLATAALQADNWPQWRGLHRDGVWSESGVMPCIPESGLAIRWRSPAGWGWSSPVVARDRVYVTDSELHRPNAKERVHCFDSATGRLLWTYAYDVTYPDWAFDSGQEGRPTATPIVDGGRLYTLGGNGRIHCFDAATGKILWEKDLAQSYTVNPLQCRASPLIEGGLLIVFTGAKPGASVVALDKETGAEVWKALDEGYTNSSPIVTGSAEVRQLIVWTQQSVTALSPSTGATIWRHRLSTSTSEAISTPVSHGTRLLIGGLMLELRPDASDPAVLWPESIAPSKRILSNTSTALLRDDYVFSARSSGVFVCLEAATGKQVWETGRISDPKNGSSVHITENGGSVILFNERGELIRARLTGEGYEEFGRARLIEPTYPYGGRNVAWTPPAYSGGHVFARSDKELVCASLEVEPGQQ